MLGKRMHSEWGRGVTTAHFNGLKVEHKGPAWAVAELRGLGCFFFPSGSTIILKHPGSLGLGKSHIFHTLLSLLPSLPVTGELLGVAETEVGTEQMVRGKWGVTSGPLHRALHRASFVDFRVGKPLPDLTMAVNYQVKLSARNSPKM